MSTENNDFSRRDFLKTVALAGAGLAAGAPSLLSADTPAATSAPTALGPVPTRKFGKTGVEVSILSLGCGNLDDKNMLLLKQALKYGITHWDTAAGYMGGNSEKGIGKYLSVNSGDRKKLFLVTKCESSHPGTLDSSLTTSLERMKTDYVDLFFLHGMESPACLTEEVKAWAEKARKDGRIRFVGLSAHVNMAATTAGAAEAGWVDGVMITYNYRNMNEDALRKAVDACAKAGVGITAMKTQAKRHKPGKPDAAAPAEEQLLDALIAKGLTEHQARLKAVWQDPAIANICSYMKNITEMKANVEAAVSQTQLSAGDLDLMRRYAQATCEGYCAACGQCRDASALPVPDVMRYLMYYHGYGEAQRARQEFARLPEPARHALARADLAGLTQACPQQIDIAQRVQEALRILA